MVGGKREVKFVEFNSRYRLLERTIDLLGDSSKIWSSRYTNVALG